MSSLDFIKQVASGDSGLATETLNNLIATTASESLEDRKKDIASSLYNTQVEESVELEEKAGYSAKAAAAGKDLGKPGKNFAKIADKAGKEYGSKEAGKRVAGAILKNLRKEDINEHVEGDEKELTKGMKLIHKNEPEESPHTAKVYHNRDWDEYQTHFYKKGRHMGEGPVGYHDNKEDAIEHAGYGVKHFNAGGK